MLNTKLNYNEVCNYIGYLYALILTFFKVNNLPFLYKFFFDDYNKGGKNKL